MRNPGGNGSAMQKPLLSLAKPDAEWLFYATVLLLALASRFWDLGARAISFDECTHALWSYKLYNGEGFTHDPMMHGPFLFHANAVIYFLFGDTDYTARIVPALFGVGLVMSPLLLRRWLGRLGAMAVAALLLISPTILYYSRYLRNDIYMSLWMMVLTAALFHVLEDRTPRWFVAGAAVLMLALATKENAYFFGYTGLVFLAAVLVWERASARHRPWLYAGGAALSVALLIGARQLQASLPEGDETASGLLPLAAALLTVVGGTLPALLASASLLPGRHPRPSRVAEAIRVQPRRAWLLAGASMLLLYVLLFTGFFTNATGLVTGIAGSVSYWLAQQGVERGSQPWYYYGLLLGMYDFLPLLLGLAGMGTFLLRGRRERSGHARDDVPAGQLEPEAGTPQQDPEPPSAPATLPLFRAFLVFWALTSLFLYAWAGERMPWMVVHQTLPLILLAGTFAGDLAHRLWRAPAPGGSSTLGRLAGGWGGALLALGLVAGVLSLYGLFRLKEPRGLWVGVPTTLLLLVLIAFLVRRLGARRSARVALSTLLAGLSLLTLRFAWMAAYINYDYATELLVYAHGTPDVTLLMDELASISQRTVGDKLIEVAYDQEAAWPLEWYLREYPNRRFYGSTPTREALDAPVVLASAEIDGKARPFLGERYHRFRLRQLWWPTEQYKSLTWERIRQTLTSPDQRRALWDILYYRRYPRTPDDWYHVDTVYLYVRKDVAQQLWNLGTPPSGALALPPDLYAEAWVDLKVQQAWGGAGSGPGQFNHPHGIAMGPDGTVYVADTDNHRVQAFTPDGAFLRAWGGGLCALDTGQGCIDPDGAGPLVEGDGQFREPWGVTVSDSGRVYVADTWNHRIQVFDADGIFVTKWGTFGETSGQTPWFYGPRDLATGPDGKLYVTDTGNERVMVYDLDGRYLSQWGGEGVVHGALAEPVGLDVDALGNVYVADTWNRRIQVFDPAHAFLRLWPVEGWYGESVENKPYLALDAQGRVYVTDPEGARVVVFWPGGELAATFGQVGLDAGSFQRPTGIALDQHGRIYVSDAEGQRVLRFEPLP